MMNTYAEIADTPTLAYRCGGSPGIQKPLNKVRAGVVQSFDLVPV